MAMMAYTLNLLMIWAAGGHWVTGGITGIAGSAVALQAALADFTCAQHHGTVFSSTHHCIFFFTLASNFYRLQRAKNVGERVGFTKPGLPPLFYKGASPKQNKSTLFTHHATLSEEKLQSAPFGFHAGCVYGHAASERGE